MKLNGLNSTLPLRSLGTFAVSLPFFYSTRLLPIDVVLDIAGYTSYRAIGLCTLFS